MPIVSVCDVIGVLVLNQNVKQYTLKLNKPTPFEPGQFLQLTTEKVSASEVWPTSRAFSITTYNQIVQDEIVIYVKNKGGYTSEIFNTLKPGMQCTIKYPYGDFLLPEIQEQTIIVGICNGVGITPFLAIMDYLKITHQEDHFHLYYSAKNQQDIFGKTKIDQLPLKNVNLFVTQEKTEYALHRRISRADFEGKYPNKETFFMISGSEMFLLDMKNLISSLGYENIILDSWS